ncbi:MAG: D-alanyl-D-alanine carboxypeptidase/D-alanyl-D-alanine-endopeptidase [Hylemonella sp.]|nr:D-alanyl-D-alanine carboxypeptidase/D-alanyl-D-alanine-endopeptidase [Hylemonella sp.]
MPLPRPLLMFWLAGLALLVGGAALAREPALPPSVTQALARAKVPAEAVSVVVEEVGAAAPLLSHRANVPMNPASVMKLVTTLAALETLGPTWSWATPVYVEGAAREGTLYGNLYIKGQGDPKLVVERLWLLLRRVQGLDIRNIAGDIVLDRSAFEVVASDPAEFDGEPLRPYNAAPDALLLNFKSVLMTFVPDRSANAAHVHVEPPLAGVSWPSHVPLRETECGDYRGTLRADFSDPAQPRFAGRYPAACHEKVWPLAYADPASYGVRAIEGMWRAIGGQLQGKVRYGAVPETLAPAFALDSPPLAEIVRDINKYSNNVMTQQLFLTLSLQQHGRGTMAGSRELMQDWWRQRFGASEVPRIVNGSGLSREDRMTAGALARLLQYAWASPLMPELMSSLPISGQDGTLRPARWRAKGSAHLKTGSLRDVASVAGIVHAEGGRRYVLVAMVNHANAGATRAAMEALVEWVAQQGQPGQRRRGRPMPE